MQFTPQLRPSRLPAAETKGFRGREPQTAFRGTQYSYNTQNEMNRMFIIINYCMAFFFIITTTAFKKMRPPLKV